MTKTRKTSLPPVGTILAVPLLDGSAALGQLAGAIELDRSGSIAQIAVAFFACRLEPGAVLSLAVDLITDPTSPMMVVSPTDDMIRYGAWHAVGHRPFRSYDNFDVARHLTPFGLNGASSTGFMTQGELECYWGIFPWDHYGDPKHIDKRLLPGHTVPPYPRHARWRKDFSEAELVDLEDRSRVRTREVLAKWPRKRSRKQVHIQYSIAGAELPTSGELRARHALEDKIGASGLGEIISAGAGEGRVDVHVATTDPEKLRRLVEGLLAAAGVRDAVIVDE